MVVSGNDALGNIQKQDIGFDVRLLPFGHNPLFVIHHDMIGAKVGSYIDVRQPVKQEKMKMSRTGQRSYVQILVDYGISSSVRKPRSTGSSWKRWFRNGSWCSTPSFLSKIVIVLRVFIVFVAVLAFCLTPFEDRGQNPWWQQKESSDNLRSRRL